MDGNHFHLQVRDLPEALAWFSQVLETEPMRREERFVALPFGPIRIVLEQGDADTVAKIGYATTDCDADFRKLTARGASVVKEPSNLPSGSRVAFLRGPGLITIELEEAAEKSGRLVP